MHQMQALQRDPHKGWEKRKRYRHANNLHSVRRGVIRRALCLPTSRNGADKFKRFGTDIFESMQFIVIDIYVVPLD